MVRKQQNRENRVAVSIRLDKDDYLKLEKMAELYSTTVSQLVRRAVKETLSRSKTL